MKYLIWMLFKGQEVSGPFKPQQKKEETRPKLEALPEDQNAGKVFEYGKEWSVEFNSSYDAGVHLEYNASDSIQTIKVDSSLRPEDWATIQAHGLKIDKYRNIKACILQGDTYAEIVDKLSHKEGYKKRTVEEYGRLIRKLKSVQNESESRQQASR
jgi:hypothetical protein